MTKEISHILLRWPDALIPPDEPACICYEIRASDDAVIRMVEIFPDGRILRNSIAHETRNGDDCPSLIEGPAQALLAVRPIGVLTPMAFENLWRQGNDRPVWFP
ncbi:MAG: hypothetical protein Q4G26_08180 [Paracoccus sp. (in: a-proteobacteria)]|nr:hypothetical protein [Paracoccus sp. (in: a-proteobacteria)]